MKIIDLLNKIANGEEVPNTIRFGKTIYEYDEGVDYVNGYGLDKEFLIDQICMSKEDLNDEVEILDEPKKDKIEIIDIKSYVLTPYNKFAILDLQNKVNELIDEVNKLI